jgi:CubicO group peptidase (beta-lactamase class C family)
MKSIQGRADGLIAEYVGASAPGASLLMTRDGFVYERAYGYRDAENMIPADANTKYMAASITKQFTAAAVVKLAARGVLSLDDALSAYFPELPGWKGSVSIRSLLNHSSGIPDYFDANFLEKYAAGDVQDGDSAAMSVISSYRELKFAPGTEHMYSNSGYVLLGEIVEKVSGRPFHDFARDELLIPAGMKDSVFLCSGKRPEGSAKGYSAKPDKRGFAEVPFNRALAGWADGNLCATARDLCRWHEALSASSVLSEYEQERMCSPLVLPDGAKTGAGFGLFIGERRGLREIWHTGSVPGYASRFSRFPSLPDGGSAAVILLCNADISCLDGLGSLFGQIVRILLEDVMAPVRRSPPERSVLEKITGRYVSALDGELMCEVSPEETGIRALGSLRGFKNGLRAFFAGTKPGSGEAFFYAEDGSDIAMSFTGDSMTVDDVGRTTRLERESGG